MAAAARRVNASVSSAPDGAVVIAQLQGLSAGANALPDLAGPTSSTEDAAETTSSIQDTNSLVDDWNSLHGAIDLSTLTGVRSELQSFNDTRGEVNGDTVESAQSQLDTITRFMEQHLAGYLARLAVRAQPTCASSPPSLASYRPPAPTSLWPLEAGGAPRRCVCPRRRGCPAAGGGQCPGRHYC